MDPHEPADDLTMREQVQQFTLESFRSRQIEKNKDQDLNDEDPEESDIDSVNHL